MVFLIYGLVVVYIVFFGVYIGFRILSLFLWFVKSGGNGVRLLGLVW